MKFWELWLQYTWFDDCFAVARRRWIWILAGSFRGAVAAFAYLKWQPVTYVSYSQLRFIPPQISERYVPSNVAMQAEQRVFALSQLVGSRLTATKLIERFGLYPERRMLMPVADLVPRFRENLGIRVIGLEGAERQRVPTIQISFRYAQPEIAQKVVQRIVELIYEENRRYRGDQSLGTTEFLDQELKSVVEQMTELEARLSGTEAANDEMGNLRGAIRAGELHRLEDRLTQLQSSLRQLTLDRDLKRSVVSNLEAQIEAAAQNPVRRRAPRTLGGDYKRQLVTQLQARLDDARNKYRENQPEVIQAQKALSDAQEDLRRDEQVEVELAEDQDRRQMLLELNRYRAELKGVEVAWARTAREEREMAASLNDVKSRYLPRGEADLDRLVVQREYLMLKDHYAQLLRKQRESQIASDMERKGQGETVELIDPPNLPLDPDSWPWYARGFVGLALGAAGGYLLSLLAWLRRPRIGKIEHVSAMLGIPVWAELPAGTPVPLGSRDGGFRLVRRSHHLPVVFLALGLALGATGCRSWRDTPESLVARGTAHLKAGRANAAILDFRRALQKDPRFAEAHYQLALALLEQAQPGQAREHLVRALEGRPDDFAIYLRLTELTYSLYFGDPGRPDVLLREVEDLAGRMTRKWPAHPDGFRLLAQVLLARHRTPEAIALMEDTVSRIPPNGALLTQLASAHYQLRDRARAQEILRRTIKDHPLYGPAYDLLYLQLMEQRESAAAREVLAAKLEHHGGVPAGLQLAAHDLAQHERPAAEATLRRLADQYAQDEMTLAQIGDFWLQRGEFDAARKAFEAGLQRFAKPRALYAGRLTEVLVAERQPAQARALVESELRKTPDDPLLRAYQSALDLDSGSLEIRQQARMRLESVSARMPNSAFVRFHLGRAYLGAGEVAKATEQLERCVMLDPNYAPGWMALAETDLARGRTALAQQRARAILTANPGYRPAVLLEARTSLAANQAEAANQALTRLLESDPGNVDALTTQGEARLRLGHPAAARQSLERAAALAPKDPRVVLLLAQVDWAENRHTAALDRLADARFADQLPVRTAYAAFALRAGRYDLSLSEYQRLSQLEPTNANHLLGIANTLGLLQRPDEAQKFYNMAQKATPDDPRPWLLAATLLNQAGRLKESRFAYEQALARDKGNPYTLNNLAYLLARTNQDLESALSYAEQARRSMPNSPEIHDTLAYVYSALGMKRNLVATLREMLEIQPTEARIRTERILRQAERGELAQVRAALEKSRSL